MSVDAAMALLKDKLPDIGLETLTLEPSGNDRSFRASGLSIWHLGEEGTARYVDIFTRRAKAAKDENPAKKEAVENLKFIQDVKERGNTSDLWQGIYFFKKTEFSFLIDVKAGLVKVSSRELKRTLLKKIWNADRLSLEDWEKLLG